MAENWSTTFYYEQELRSSYMNNMIKGLIKPGIYNMNAALYTLPGTIGYEGQQGIWLRILAGTTMVFSNGYDSVDSKLVRNLDSIGSYVVKCVANVDMDFHLAKPQVSYSAVFEEAEDNPGVSKAPVLFVYASFKYDEEAAGSTEPLFKLAVPSSNTYLGSNLAYKLPNEDLDGASAEPETSYLIIGTAIDNGKLSAVYTAGTDWRNEAPYDGREAWLSNHIFTARSLPEYTGAISKNYGQQLSAIAFGPNYNKLYMTSGHFFYNSILYSVDGQEWKTLYGQGAAPNATVPASISGGITDHIYSTAEATAFTKEALSLTGNANKVYMEFLFLAVRSEYANATTINIDELLEGSSLATTRRFIPYKVVCTAPAGVDFNTATALSEALRFTLGTSIVPLDTSVLNINRLKSFFYNRNILLPVVDKMRQAADTASPYLLPDNGQSLIPVAVSFRKVDGTGTDFTDLQSSKTFAQFGDAAGALGASACNPANILSFFEMQASSFAIFSTALAVQEVYDVLPFLD